MTCHAIATQFAVRAAFLGAALLAATASAEVIFTTYGASESFHPTSGQAVAERDGVGTSLRFRRSAVGFTPLTPGEFMLDSITIPLSQITSSRLHRLRVRLVADDAGRPGSTIEVLAQDLNPPNFPLLTPTTTTLVSTQRPILVGGTQYWIVAELGGDPLSININTDFVWHATADAPVTDLLILQQDTPNALPVDPWPATTPFTFPLGLRVDASPATGACCNAATGACAVVPRISCFGSLGLTSSPAGSTCSPASCPAPCPGDFNRSGSVSQQDLFDFVAAYFAGC